MREHGIAAEHIAEADLVTRRGTFRTVAFRDPLDGNEHLALVHGDPRGKENVLVRVHSECVTGDIFAATDFGVDRCSRTSRASTPSTRPPRSATRWTAATSAPRPGC